MTAPVAFSSIVIALADHLSAALAGRGDSVAVFNSVPRTGRPSRYVLVVQPGGDQANLITDRPRVVCEVVDVYGKALAELATVVRALVTATAPGYVGEIWVDRANHISAAFSPDPDTESPRCLITTEFWCRGTILT